MYLHIIAILIAVVAGYLNLIRQYQMLQQNSYYAARYLGWLKENISVVPCILKGVLVILAMWAAFLGNTTLKDSLTLFAAVALYFGWRAFSMNASSVKGLVYTARIKRTLFFSTLVLVALGVAGFVTHGVLQLVLLTILVVFALFPEEADVREHLGEGFTQEIFHGNVLVGNVVCRAFFGYGCTAARHHGGGFFHDGNNGL